MTNFKCERCHYEAKQKIDYLRHLQKKNQCPANFSTISNEELLERLQQPKPHVCEFCNKSFSHTKNLTRHCKDFHAALINSQNTTQTHAHNTTTSSHNTTNTNTTQSHNNQSLNTNSLNTVNNPTININLNVFGQERIDYILEDTEFLTKCLKDVLRNGITDIFKAVHLNNEVPENKNIKLKRQHHPKHVEVFMENEDGENDWVTKLADPIIEDSIKKFADMLYIHKDNVFREIENPTIDDQETDDRRREKLSSIKQKKRSSNYAQIRDSIMLALKHDKKAAPSTSSTTS
jgi:uncharacterized C2H2 Zn-finger protein